MKPNLKKIILLSFGLCTQVSASPINTVEKRSISNSAPRSLQKRSFSYHDNAVSFHVNQIATITTVGWYVEGGTFQINSHSVTDGQDPDNHLVDGSSQTMTNYIGSELSQVFLTFSVGRSNSEEVADWWNNVMPTIHTTFGHLADDLNFAVLGKLTIMFTNPDLALDKVEFTFEDVGFAQGHAFWDDNWWFGCLTCTNIRNDRVETFGVDKDGNRLYVHFQRGQGTGDSDVFLSDISYNTPITEQE